MRPGPGAYTQGRPTPKLRKATTPLRRSSHSGDSRKLRQEFIRNCLPLANKAGMTETARGAIQHGRASSTCAILLGGLYCVGLRTYVW
jgi:hypothetical protein